MSEFCLECFKQFEPNANELNTVLSNWSELCEGCGQIKQIVISFDDTREVERLRKRRNKKD